MADMELKIFGIEVAVGGTADPDIEIKSMFNLTHSEIVETSATVDEINTLNFSLSQIYEDAVSEGDIEEYE